MVESTGGVGRRERKKLMLREALIKSSYELFATKGYDETRIEDITNEVDVSARTFFRYFASKEDVVLDYQREEHKDLVDAISKRPADEPPLLAVRHSVVSVVRGCEEGAYGFDADRFMALQRLIRTHPAILARSIIHSEEHRTDLVNLIADRMQLDPNADVRPSMLFGIIEYAHTSAYDAWKRQSGSSTSYSTILDAVFEIIENGFILPASRF